MTYNPKNANPFQVANRFPEWTGNNLLLLDPQMRRKAGVTVLDADISEMFNQQGGSATGAPFYLSQFGSTGVNPYEQTAALQAWVQPPMPVHKPAAQQTGGMQMASHYFNNTHRW